MGNKRDLGKLFKEQLANVETSPNEKLWERIEKTLDQKKRTRFYFIWLFSLLSLLLGVFFVTTVLNNDKITSTEINASEPIHQEKKNSVNTTENTKRNRNDHEIGSTPISKTIENKAEKKVLLKENLEVSSDSLRTAVIDGPETEDYNKNVSNKNRQNPISIVGKSEKNNSRTIAETNDLHSTPLVTGDSREMNTDTHIVADTSLANNPINPAKEIVKSTMSQTSETSDGLVPKKDTQAIGTRATTAKKKDSLQRDSVVKKKKAGKLLKKDTMKLNPPEEEKLKKYAVYPFVGTTSLGTLKKASSIDSRLNNYRQASAPRIGYGAYLVFEPNDEWRIRLGAGFQQIEKSTFDVPVAATDPNTNFYRDVAFENNRSFSTFSGAFTQSTNVVLRERLSYLEIPVQISYSFLKRKNFIIDALTGIGVLYLKGNELAAIRTSGETIVLGKNRNYSEGSFGIHLGLGLNYRINESAQIHLEPIFKPQIGFYEKNIENNPFLFNLQFGLQYRL